MQRPELRINNNFFSESNISEDIESDVVTERSSSSSMWSCIERAFGIKSNTQRMQDVKNGMNSFINTKQRHYRSLEMKIAKYERDLKECKFRKDKPNGVRNYKLINNTRKRMNKLMAEITSTETRLFQIEDIADGKQLMDTMVEVNKSLKKLNLPKAIDMVERTMESVNENNEDINELNELLAIPTNINESQLEKEFESYWNEDEDEIEESTQVKESRSEQFRQPKKHTRKTQKEALVA